MGCWNETCMLSHMQILNGDDIKVIILVKNADKSNPCYYNENYSPLILPFDAKYNDYGGISMEGNNLPDYSKQLLRSFKFTNKDSNIYNLDDVEKIISYINDSSYGLYVEPTFSGIGEGYKKLECVYIHKALYDILVDDFKNRKPFNSDKTISELYKERYDTIKDCILLINKLHENKSEESFLKSFDLTDEVFRLFYKVSKYGYSFTREMVARKNLNKDNIDEFLKEMLDYTMFGKSLEFGRYGYLSRCGSGGQDLDVRVQNLIAKFIIDFSERKNEDDENIYTMDESFFWY